MAAKKLSAISIATAFVLIASFIAALLPQAISPQPAQAATVVTFTTVGTTTWTAPAGVTSVDVLVVAGGGGGGGIGSGNNPGGGGGGAGGFRSISNYAVTPNQSYTVMVGAGGSAGVDGTKGGSGGNSSFATITANGGGGGASSGGANNNGVAGGSGGGGRRDGTALGGAGNTPVTSPSQGNRGGNGSAANLGSGGGGGASAVGANGNSAQGGKGGNGSVSSISGSSVIYAGGGGGGGWGDNGGAGGTGGGGSSPSSRGRGNSGQNGLGGGGGGAAGSNSGNAFSGGAGGSGIVIIRYTTYTLTTTTGGNGTVTTPGIGTYTYGNGTVVSIVATPNSCYAFLNWSGNTSTILPNVSASSATITMNGNYSIQANFAMDTFTLSVTPNLGAGGSPYYDGSGPFNCGTNVTIHANTSPTYIFAGWTPAAGIANASAENTTVTMSQDRVLTANYLSAIPAIGAVDLWTTGSGPAATTSITPQSELNIKIPVSENRSFNYLVTLQATLYYDVDGTYNATEVPVSGNTQTCAIFTWTRATNTLTMDPNSSTTWSALNSSSVFPSLTSTSGTFEFHFKAGKVATQTTGAANWHIYVKAMDSYPYTGNGTRQNLSMNWYGEIKINTAGVDWGDVTANLDFNESDPSMETNISVTYISNGNYNEQVASESTWYGLESNAKLNTAGNPGPNEFSLRADDDNTLDGSMLVALSYTTFGSGTQTGEDGKPETANSLWLKLGTPFASGKYNGVIGYRIAP